MTDIGRFEVSFEKSDEIALTATVASAHRALLTSYRMTARRTEEDPRQLILKDLRNFLDLGALTRATDMLIVLALLARESDRSDRRLKLAVRRQRDAITLQHWRGGRNSAGPRVRNAAQPQSEGTPSIDKLESEGDGGEAPC